MEKIISETPIKPKSALGEWLTGDNAVERHVHIYKVFDDKEERYIGEATYEVGHSQLRPFIFSVVACVIFLWLVL